jgi:hypothetical protein
VKPRDIPRLLRTVLHYKPVQLAAQLRHVMVDEGRPGVPRGEAPPLSVETSHAPFLPAPPHARFDGEATFELIRRAHRFEDGIDWQFDGHGPLWAFHLHQFDWARDPALSPEARGRAVENWITNCERGHGWAPHPISLRILSWGKLRLTPGLLALSPEVEERMRASLAQQAETLSRRIEVRLQANHLLSNLLGVVFAGLLFEGAGADRWLGFASRLRRELEVQVLPDGSHVERSPMYHALLLENLLDLLNLARAAEGRAPRALVAALEDATARMLGAHEVWIHPDGEIALFSDSAFDIAHPPAEVARYAASLGVTPRAPAGGQLEDAGIYRLQDGAFTLIATTAPPAPSYQPGHAHCDALSFELSYGEERVVSDTGVTEYVPGPLRDASRATTSHATLQFDGHEQSEIWSAHRVGGRAHCEVVEAGGGELRARCSPWSRREIVHERHFRVQNGSVAVEDCVSGAAAQALISLPFGSDVVVVGLDVSAARAQLELRSGARLELELPAGVDWSVARRPWFPRFGEALERDALVGKAAAPVTGRVVFRVATD